MPTVADLKAKFSADTGDAERGIKRLDKSIRGLGGDFSLGNMFSFAGGELIASGIRNLGGALVGGMTGAITASKDLNAQISSIGATSGASAEDLAAIKDLINDLGIDPKLKVGATEAADAIEMLSKNGVALPDIMDGAARATVLLANATGAEFGTAADIASSAMSVFGIEAKDMSDAVNGITSVAVNSRFDVNDYALALSQAGGVAALVGVEFDDFNTAIAAISPGFASGSDAGTSFKTFLQRLAPDTKPAIEAMTELGLITEDGSNQFFTAQGAMKDQAEIAGILHNATMGLSEEQKILAFSTIFGTDAMRAAGAMAGMTEDDFRKLKATMANTDAEESAAKMMDNLAGDMEIFGGVAESLQTQLGDKLEPALRSIFQGLTPLLADMTPALLGFADSLSTNFIVPAIDNLVSKLERAQDLSSLAFTVTGGDAFTSFLAGLGSMTGAEVTIDATAQVVSVDWLSGGFTHTYDAEAQVTETSVLWGAWVHTYSATTEVFSVLWGAWDHVYNTSAQIGQDSVLWGAWTHSYDVSAKIDDTQVGWGAATHTYDASAEITEKSIGWGLVTHTYDAKAEIREESVLWGLWTTQYDAMGRIISTEFAPDLPMPVIKATAQIEAFLASEEGLDLNMAERFTLRFAPGVIEFLKAWAPVIKPPTQTEMGPLLTMTVPTLPEGFWPAWPALPAWPDLPDWVWPDVPTFAWPSLPVFAWPSLPSWAWPDLPSFSWPSLPTFAWPALPAWVWPSLPSWRWPSIPMPGWVSTLAGLLGSGGPKVNDSSSFDSLGSIGGNAGGTSFWRGGWTVVGEQGPELLNVPRGAQILSNANSLRLAGGSAGGTTVVMNNTFNVSSGVDIHAAAYTIAEIVQRRSRR